MRNYDKLLEIGSQFCKIVWKIIQLSKLREKLQKSSNYVKASYNFQNFVNYVLFKFSKFMFKL